MKYLKIVNFSISKSAVTRIRTWVIAATTQCTNHYTITAEHSQRRRGGWSLVVIIITKHVYVDIRKLVNGENQSTGYAEVNYRIETGKEQPMVNTLRISVLS